MGNSDCVTLLYVVTADVIVLVVLIGQCLQMLMSEMQWTMEGVTIFVITPWVATTVLA